MRRFVLITLVALSGMASRARAQSETDYWGCFLASPDGAHPVLVLTSEVSTRATVVWGGKTTQYGVIPGTPTEIRLDSTVMAMPEEMVGTQTIHVVGRDPIQAVLATTHQGAGEATRLLPVEALGRDYLVISHPSIYSAGECAIVAPYDGTNITIIPSTRTAAGIDSGVPITVTLNRGEMYLVQSTVDFSQPVPYDLTGTTITASGPVAVFSGSYLIAIPEDSLALNPLYEQMPPSTTLGTRYCIVPFARRTKGDEVRITATSDATDVIIGGAPPVTLARGQTIGTTLRSPTEITATRPVAIAQFSHSCRFEGNSNSMGDPYMVMAAPASRPLQRASFGGAGRGFDSNYVNVVALNGAMPVTLDGAALGTLCVPAVLPGGALAYTVRIQDAHHVLASSGPFLATVYGDSTADGYGYTINATGPPPIDTVAPILVDSGSCSGGLVFAVSDTGVPASGIRTIQARNPVNCSVVIPPYTACSPSVPITFRKIAPTLPTSFTIDMTDCAGNTSTITRSCPGITDTVSPQPTARGDCASGFRIECTDTEFAGTGIRSIAVVQSTNMSVTVPPITGCPGVVNVSASVIDPRLAASFRLDMTDCSGNVSSIERTCFSTADTTPPIGGFTAQCTPSATLTIRDTGAIVSGIGTIFILDSTNIRLVIPAYAPCATSVTIGTAPIDPTIGSSWMLRVLDCAYNASTFADICSPVAPESLYVSVDSARGLPGDEVSVALRLETAPNAFQPDTVTLGLVFDPAVAVFRGWDQAGTLTQNYVLAQHTSLPLGTTIGTFSGSSPITSSGVLARARFMLLAAPHTRTALSIIDTGWKFTPRVARGPYVLTQNQGALVVDSICGWHSVTVRKSLALTVSPTPARDRTMLSVAHAYGAPVEIVVSNVLGAQVYSATLPASGTMELSCAALPPGVYMVRASSGMDRAVQHMVITR